MDGCFLDELGAFGVDADQSTTASQDEGKCRKMTKQGAKRFMAKLIAAEKVRTDYGMQQYARTGRERPRTSKRVRAVRSP